MKQKITCPCGTVFSAEVSEIFDLDKDAELIDSLLNGTFLSYTCPGCGKNHKPEFPIVVHWPSRKITYEIRRELDRGAFYLEKTARTKNKDEGKKEVIIGYPELAERILVIKSNLSPIVVEAIKYILYQKAEENYPEKKAQIWFYSFDGKTLEFHIHGIRENETAIMKIPLPVYEQTADDHKKNPKKEIYSSLEHNSYISVRNVLSRRSS